MIYKKICPYCGIEFETEYATKIYCSNYHKECSKKKRRKDRGQPLEYNTIYTKECPSCLKIFTTEYKDKVYCCKTCQQREHDRRKRKKDVYSPIVFLKICKHCNKEFTTKHNGNLYCSNECRNKHYYKPKKVIIKQCLYCGEEFEATNNRKIYCCYEHKERARYPKKELDIKICISCGKEFKPTKSTKIYCSKRCCDREYSKISHRLREARARENGVVDHSITLHKLIERDKGICKICNKPIDETDYTYVNDYKVYGNYYPSIDHIIPLSKGGVHQWNNVQLAHRRCNSSKQDKIV